MGTKNKPGQFDCYANAEPDEPMFVLLGRDPASSLLVTTWTKIRTESGIDLVGSPKILEAEACAEAMTRFATERGRGGDILAVLGAMDRIIARKLGVR